MDRDGDDCVGRFWRYYGRALQSLDGQLDGNVVNGRTIGSLPPHRCLDGSGDDCVGRISYHEHRRAIQSFNGQLDGDHDDGCAYGTIQPHRRLDGNGDDCLGRLRK